jgi:hypothetical protein
MTTIRAARAGALLALALAMTGLAACGSTATTPTGTASPAPSVTHQGATAQPAPTPVPASRPATTAPQDEVVSSRVSYPWHSPNDVNRPGSVGHAYPVPPVPRLIAVGAGDHPRDPGERPYNRLSFTFTKGFPSYQVKFADALRADPSGHTVPLTGKGVLEVTFHGAQAHTNGGASSVATQPAAQLGYTRMLSWAPGGDYEGVLSYGIGIDWPIAHSNPQIPVRTIEVEKVTPMGQHLYIVAIDVDASTP